MARSSLLIAAIALLAGCADTTHSTGQNALNQESAAVLRDLSRCIRAHGLPSFPDPVIGNDGVPRYPDSAPRVPESARQPCAEIANRIPAAYQSTQPVSSADYQKLLAFARCVRAHGIADWPDPNPLGEFPIDRRIQADGKRIVLRAEHTCGRANPDPSGGIHVIQAR
jgi:hypothetical protein